MNNKVLLATDLHVHPHKRKIERLEDCLKVLEWIFETAREQNIDTILFGGDLLHDRQKIEVYTYQRLFETLKRNLTGNLKLYLLLGNHDLWFNDNTSISSVVPFSSLPGVVIIDQPTRLNLKGVNWDFIPFTHDPITAVENLKKQPGSAQYCLGHIALDGAILHGTHTAEVSIEHDGDMVRVSADLFAHYKTVIFGHYHCAQKINDVVEYLGSPLQLSFGEANQPKYIMMLDCATHEKTYIENTFSPKHLVLRQNELEKHNLQEIL
jgi:DNA repair exonuclease SbcCD nuclease subunit